jgi:amidase
MARTVADTALMLSAIAGPDPRAPLSIVEPGERFAQPLDRDLRGVRIAWGRDLGGLPIDRNVTATIDAQRHVFEALGCVVEDAEPDWSGADEAFKAWRAWDFELGLGELLDTHRDQLKDTVIWNIEAGRRLTGSQLAAAERARAALYQRLCEFMERYAFLALPVSQVPPFDVTQPYVTEIAGVAQTTYIDWMRSCYYVSVTGLPAISVPCGFTPEGLPVGIQLVGRYQDDWGVLQLAHTFEQATGFWKTRPPVVARAE